MCIIDITDSEVFIKALGDKTFTKNTNFVYNFSSETKGYSAAKKEFDSMNLSNVRIYNQGTDKETIVGELSNGDTVNLHTSSSKNIGEPPSIEIYDPITEKQIKIRY